MSKLSDYMIISDVDGTLINFDGIMPERNRKAIGRFIKAGGRFGIATGRSRRVMLKAVEGLPVNGPCVLYNGGAVYDVAADKLMGELFLPSQAKDYIIELGSLFQNCGVMVVKDDDYYSVQQEVAFALYYTSDKAPQFRPGMIEEISMPWYKALFQVDSKDFDRFFQTVQEKNYPGVRFLASTSSLIEMLPENSSKGRALEKMIELGVVKREHLAAIGDYYNDREMIETAGIGVTLQDAPEDLRELADLVVGKCEQGAVADLIEHLESICE